MDKEQLIAEMAVENAELRERLAAKNAELERVRKACSDLLEYAMHASVESGYCMCGDSMENHSGMDHAPVDAGEYGLGQVIEQAQAALASPAGEPVENGGLKLSQSQLKRLLEATNGVTIIQFRAMLKGMMGQAQQPSAEGDL